MSTAQDRHPCPVCGQMIVVNAKVCRFCGEEFQSTASGDKEGDSTGGVIPYKNPPALIAYYCGVFSLLACIPFFFPLPIVAFVLGLKGLKKAKAEPHVKGQVHAWIGVVCGAVFGIIGIVITVIAVIGIIGAMTQKGRF
ncbi:MAG: hypothetical protein HY290_23245 [Planctomycetia bacterium]|nr:hypothetical protein [Planctomycetia bacterium]